MQKIALNVSGIIFVLDAILHEMRLVMKVPMTLGETEIPLMASAVAALIGLLLALWMFMAARKSEAVK